MTSAEMYNLKPVRFQGKERRILLQNKNGPCPLIAICNVLLLRGKLDLGLREHASLQDLLNEVCHTMSDTVYKQSGDRSNQEQNLNDAIGVLSKLAKGLDVNVKFSGPENFEFTSELAVFDLCDVRLFHGWLIDPQNRELAVIVGNDSYNQIVVRAISAAERVNTLQGELSTLQRDRHSGLSNSNVPSEKERQLSDEINSLSRESILLQDFLDSTQSQLTYHGLAQIHTRMSDGQLAVLFRNNHFSTIYKINRELYLLVTDQGFLREPHIVWERLREVEGDSDFVTAEMQPSPAARSVDHTAQDYLIAKSIQEEEHRALAMQAIPTEQQQQYALPPPGRVVQSQPIDAPIENPTGAPRIVDALPIDDYHSDRPNRNGNRQKDCVMM
eukprot:c8149_g1_i1.p1 GENE.c8149_g1_i1~~c8149_g1_i1.p1  ORF type:complete len:398 (+),score=91.63 c8149_g1_i1:39-1196(+)